MHTILITLLDAPQSLPTFWSAEIIQISHDANSILAGVGATTVIDVCLAVGACVASHTSTCVGVNTILEMQACVCVWRKSAEVCIWEEVTE